MLALNGFTGKGWIGRQIRLRAVLMLASRLEAALSAPMDMDSCTMGNIITFSDNRKWKFSSVVEKLGERCDSREE